MNKVKINDNKSKKIIIWVAIVISVILLGITGFNILIKKQAKDSVVTVYEEDDPKKSEIEWFENDDEKNELDIDNIINQNLTEKEKEEVETQVVLLEYQTQYQNNKNLPKGMVKVLQQGQDGEQEIIIRKKYVGDQLISDEQTGRKITTP